MEGTAIRQEVSEYPKLLKRKKMKSNYEKNQFYEGERAAVAMRRLEYNKQFD